MAFGWTTVKSDASHGCVASAFGASTLEMDTAKDQWSIAAGTYSCRFTPGTAVAAHMAAGQLADKLKGIAAKQLNVLPDDVELDVRVRVLDRVPAV